MALQPSRASDRSNKIRGKNINSPLISSNEYQRRLNITWMHFEKTLLIQTAYTFERPLKARFVLANSFLLLKQTVHLAF